MSDDKPFFRFNPGAYDTGRSFKPSDEPCGVCARPSVWLYNGVLYAAGPQPTVCARCIADGRLDAHFGEAGFGFHDMALDEVEPELTEEISSRTPGFATFNPFTWPVIDGVPLAFLGYGDDAGMWNIPAAREAMVEAFMALGDELAGPTSYALVFRQVEGDRYRVWVDLD